MARASVFRGTPTPTPLSSMESQALGNFVSRWPMPLRRRSPPRPRALRGDVVFPRASQPRPADAIAGSQAVTSSFNALAPAGREPCLQRRNF